MDPEILYFGHFEAEKIELVGEISEILKNDKFLIFWGGGYFNFETQSQIKNTVCPEKKEYLFSNGHNSL